MNPTEPKAIQALCEIARQAGHAIMQVYEHSSAVQYKDDNSPLTEADLQSDALIRQGLESLFPGVLVWSEESRSAQADAACFFLVDPLDGTREFVNRNGEFTVNIAWVEKGRAVLGLIHVPVTGEIFWAVKGSGTWCQPNVQAHPVRLNSAEGVPVSPLRVLSSRSYATGRTLDWFRAVKVPYTTVEAGSALKFCRLAQGQADVYPRLGPTCQWDTAAGQVIVEEAGGLLLGPDGLPFRYGLDRPVLNPDFLVLAQPGLLKQLPWPV